MLAVNFLNKVRNCHEIAQKTLDMMSAWLWGFAKTFAIIKH